MIDIPPPRSVEEWIGNGPDAPVPQRVRLRVYLRDKGRCQVCSRQLGPSDKWICDHKTAIVNGGANLESNLQTICEWCDKRVKTPADVAQKSATYRKRLRHVGIRKPRTITRWRKFNGDIVSVKRER